MLRHNWAKSRPNIGVAAPRAPVGGWGPRSLKSLVMGTSLLGNCYLENKFRKKLSYNDLAITDKYIVQHY